MLLLDTHALLWLDRDDANLGPQSRNAIAAAWAEGLLAVSSISFWEVALLQQRGRIALACAPDSWRHDWLQAGLREIPLDGGIALRATTLAHFHPDPADRFLTATALNQGARLLTADQAILDWHDPLPRLNARH